MTYRIERGGTDILTVTFDGPVNLAERKKAVDEVCALVGNMETVQLLIDVRTLTMDMTIEEQEYFGAYLAGRTELATAKVAVLHAGKHNPNAVIDACAYIEGYHVAEFNQAREATNWLLGNMK